MHEQGTTRALTTALLLANACSFLSSNKAIQLERLVVSLWQLCYCDTVQLNCVKRCPHADLWASAHNVPQSFQVLTLAA